MDDARPKMCYSPSPPPSSKAIFSSYLNFDNKCSSGHINVYDNTSFHCRGFESNYIISTKDQDNMQGTEDIKHVNDSKAAEETASDYKQWLHAMKLVARLPGGIPPEFRRKLWLSLADKYLKSKNVDWAHEEEKCFREKWREDDEELGIQIVKDLHRTGSTLCTGPAGDLNQAKLKKILLGYARYNPEVGYCQGFNMLGALILQVMDKDESGSIKVMIYLVEGILPAGYFCGSMGGLQADMAVFRELMQTKLPRLAKHLQKLQGPIENAYEPPLTNVFTMQWFLTMFCTCLPMSCVLRVWDLVLIEGSDVLLRTALVLWSLLEEKVLSARSADDFYGKMGSFSSELLNGHLIDSNGLIEKVVQLGPIADIEKLREKHLCNIAPMERQQELQLYFGDDEPDMDESSRLAVATVWGIPWGRRGSQGQPNNNVAKQPIENKDRIALDISLLKKQYDKLRERQKQAQIILTTACSSAARQSTTVAPLPVNQLLSGRPAIITNKGRRCGPPTGAIPPARKPSLPAVLHDKELEKQLRRDESVLWKDISDTKNRRDSLSWKEIKAERAALLTSGSVDGFKSQKIRTGRLGKSDSSSYSEESDDNDNKIDEDASSTDTSIDDEDSQATSNDKKQLINIESNHKSSNKSPNKSKKTSLKQRRQSVIQKNSGEKLRPKSWAPSNSEIPFILMTADSPNQSADENPKTEEIEISKWESPLCPAIANNNTTTANNATPLDVSFSEKKIPLRENSANDDDIEAFDISSAGVTNEYFERVNSTERPTKLNLFYSLNEDEPIRNVLKIKDDELLKSKQELGSYANGNNLNKNKNIRCMDLLVDYSEKSSTACIEEAKTEISGLKTENILRKPKTSAEKRRDPRRLTLSRSSTMDIEKRFGAFEKRFSMEICTSYTRFSDELESNIESKTKPHLEQDLDFKKISNARDPIYNGSHHDNAILQDKKIPTTADLEERFQNIQKQLVRDRSRMNNSPCDSESNAKQKNSNTFPDSNIRSRPENGRSYKQPDRDDVTKECDGAEGDEVLNKNSDTLENLSGASEPKNVKNPSGTQVPQSDSINASTSTISETKLVQKKKKPPDEETEEDAIIERDNSNEKSSSVIEENRNEIQKAFQNPTTHESEEDTQKETEIVDEEIDRNQIESDRNAPPSTEELEKRFSALEEKFNSSKGDSKTSLSDVSPERPKQLAATSEIVKEADTQADTETLNKTEKPKKPSSVDAKTSLTNSKSMTEKATQRRLSEPPSTEDLERRYEVLKRRMSSRNFETKTFHKESLSPQLQPTNRSKDITEDPLSKKSPPSIENLEERFEKLQTKNEVKREVKMQSPPSTENLEERYEKLQHKIDSKDAKRPQSQATTKNEVENIEIQSLGSRKSIKATENLISHIENEVETSNRFQSEKHQDENIKQDENNFAAGNSKNFHNKNQASEDHFSYEIAEQEVEAISRKNKTVDVLSKNANKIKIKLIEELQAKIKEHSSDANVDSSLQKKMAVIEELKSKIEPLPEKFLKPTQISSRRPPSQSTLLQSLSFNDETLESHATSANRKLGKHEHASTINRKMVRRFSDLPSRADLENRLQFLEDQLSKTVCMQRRASDSEVASKSHSKKKLTVSNIPSTDSLEYRVQELEKRLKENRAISMDVECSSANHKNDPDIEISQVDLATDSVALTGKELVRYSSHGEFGDIERQNPINISINIQMTLNKDDIATNKTTPDSKTHDLDKRLQTLEERFKTSLVKDSFGTAADNLMKSSEEEDGRPERGQNQADENVFTENKPNRNTHSSEDVDHRSPDRLSPTNTATENTQAKSFPDTDPFKSPENHAGGGLKEESEKVGDNQISDGKESPTQVIKKKQTIESTKSEDANIEKEEEIKESKVEKGVEDDIPENKTKENEIVKQSKTEDEGQDIAKRTESNSKDDKNIINSLQQKPPTQPSEVSESQEVGPIFQTESESKTFGPDSKDTMSKTDESKTTSKAENFIGKGSQFVPIEVNKKTLVLLLDNEPKAVKVRRLTRANTEELEDLFQALEKHLNDRENQTITKTNSDKKCQNEIETTKTMSDLTKEIEEYSKRESNKTEENDKLSQGKQTKQEEPFDWGTDPIKYHLKKKTVYLPSTKELEARFRSLERQIKLLEDVEKINVEHRLTEIERKIKLQYSLSHEKDLNKFLELCEGRDPDEISGLEIEQDQTQNARIKEDNNYSEQHYRTADLERLKSKQNQKKHPIHPLEMLLDASPGERDIPTTGELEHRIRVLEGTRCSSSPPSRKSRSQSPPVKQAKSKSNIPIFEKITASPSERELPTAEELEARLEALEREQSFNFKMQKDFQQFNQKLKDVVSPSLSFDEFKSPAKVADSGQTKVQTSSTIKQTINVSAINPKTIRFHDIGTSQKEIETKKPLSKDKESQQASTVREGLGVMGIRLMRETSPLRRKGTHTGVPLRTGENINDQLTSIQNTIKSIDSLCEEKPYRKERCQQYIDSLFSDSTHFAHKKASLEDLTSRNLSRSTSREIGPSIRISDHSPAFTRSMGSADSIRAPSPTSPLQYRSNRDLRREPSPRRRREEDQEEHESRVRRDNLLPNNFNYSHSRLSHTSDSSLTQFHKVDSQLIPNDVENEHEHECDESLRHPTNSTNDSLIYHDNTNTSNVIHTTSQRIFNADVTAPDMLNSQRLERPTLQLFQTFPSTSNTPIYTPAKLEIRHTTVTSTFYDRVLTEKQLEKQNHFSISASTQSPMISPQFEKNVKPVSQQQTAKSPTKLFANDMKK